LRALTTPILFVQGTRDSLCPLDLLEHVRKEMKALNLLHVVEGGDHSLLVRKRDLNAARVDRRVLEAIAEFIGILAPPNAPKPAAAAAKRLIKENSALFKRLS
jgi:pimeloyl-ACP methyl ester carboxylesterase